MDVSLYYGDEAFLLQEAVKQLRQRIVNPAMAGLGHKILQNPSVADVLEAVGAVCFNLGGKTLVEIQEFAFLSKAASSAADEKQLAELMALLQAEDDTKHVLFLNTKINRSVKFAKWLTGRQKQGLDLKECKALAFYQTEEAAQRLLQLAKQKDIAIEPKAVACLVQNQGVALLPLMTEIEKLSAYAAERTITVADVQLLSNHNENTFQMLADWLQQRNRAHVFYTLEDILLRQHPVQVFALIQGWLGGLFQLRYWQQQGVSQAQMAEMTKKHPYKIRKDLEEYAKVPFERLNFLREKLLMLEYQAKTGLLNPKLALELLMGS